MKHSKYFSILMTLLLNIGCQSNPQKQGNVDTSSAQLDSSSYVVKKTAETDTSDSLSINDGKSLIVMQVRDYLQKTYKDDISKGIIDSSSRKFIIREVHLNSDGKKEIFVGLTGPYFCGSGGCTFLLLNSDGNLNTKFTVSDYPFTVAPEETKYWHDLLVQSRGTYHRLKFNGSAYPSNPSVEAGVDILPVKDVTIVFDLKNDKYTWFEF